MTATLSKLTDSDRARRKKDSVWTRQSNHSLLWAWGWPLAFGTSKACLEVMEGVVMKHSSRLYSIRGRPADQGPLQIR
ncbi:hypothetical protein BDV32DRAFT_102671 [Aspergillus pseudonomiae]|nr:hypothetical protein BDV32DRAFT_102671 [Aspergillus pseudonomiae]